MLRKELSKLRRLHELRRICAARLVMNICGMIDTAENRKGRGFIDGGTSVDRQSMCWDD